MPISFAKIAKGSNYSRQALAELWGYTSFHAIARGVVTPRNDNKIVLFVTEQNSHPLSSTPTAYPEIRSNGRALPIISLKIGPPGCRGTNTPAHDSSDPGCGPPTTSLFPSASRAPSYTLRTTAT